MYDMHIVKYMYLHAHTGYKFIYECSQNHGCVYKSLEFICIFFISKTVSSVFFTYHEAVYKLNLQN